MKNINKRKMKDEMKMLGMILIGLILVICNQCKIVPGVDTAFAYGVTSVIVYFGLPIGIMEIVFGLAGFLEVRNKKYSRKRRS